MFKPSGQTCGSIRIPERCSTSRAACRSGAVWVLAAGLCRTMTVFATPAGARKAPAREAVPLPGSAAVLSVVRWNGSLSPSCGWPHGRAHIFAFRRSGPGACPVACNADGKDRPRWPGITPSCWELPAPTVFSQIAQPERARRGGSRHVCCPRNEAMREPQPHRRGACLQPFHTPSSRWIRRLWRGARRRIM